MGRKIYLIIPFLIIVFGTFLFLQWNSFIKEHDSNQKNANQFISYDFKINHTKNELHVEEIISNLSNHQKLYLPKNIKNFKCEISKNKDCKIINGNKQSINLNERCKSVTFIYEIPLSHATSFLLSNWFIKAQTGQKSIANLEIVEGNKNSEWIAGAKKIAYTQKKYIQFYKWEKKDASDFPVFYSDHSLVQQKYSQFIQLFHEQKLAQRNIQTLESLKKIPYFTNITIIETIQNKEFISPEILVLNEHSNLQTIKEQLIYSYVQERMPFKFIDQRWVWDVMTALILEKELGSIKAKEVEHQLFSQLSQGERNQFIHIMLHPNQTDLSFKMMDQALGKVKKGYTTNFFALSQGKSTLPLYFYEKQSELIVDGIVLNENPIYINKQTYIPLKEVLENLGYQVKWDNHSLFIDNMRHKKWQLFLNKNLIKINGEEYGLYKNPIIITNGQFYLPVNWLNKLFSIKTTIHGYSYVFSK